ncbi:MAG: DUF748 domain-containing protein [Cyclobacteriaceae bacterium]|nr:DUF748 domain-containing protein [Cyclobacteriaceae bacterium]
MKKIKKKYLVIGSILVVLLIGRLILPYFVTRYVNKVLANIPGYSGSITGVDIWLVRGAYVIHDLKIFKVDGSEKVPFVDIPSTDLSVEWKALIHGSVVGEVIFENPSLNFIGGNKDSEGKENNQTGADVDWTVPLKELIPLQINRLEVTNASVFFYDFTSKPKVDLSLKQLNLLATNLNNAERQTVALPSKINLTANSIGDGQLSVAMNINVLKEIPDLDMDLKFENINMPALNDFFLAYSNVDIEKGTFFLYSEITAENGIINGYVKPLAQDVTIVNWKEDKQNVFNLVWQSIVGFFVEVFENQKEDQFATKVPLAGDLNNVKTKTWPTLWNIFTNAFVKAFEMKTDNTIKFIPKTKAELRKEKREANKKN